MKNDMELVSIILEKIMPCDCRMPKRTVSFLDKSMVPSVKKDACAKAWYLSRKRGAPRCSGNLTPNVYFEGESVLVPLLDIGFVPDAGRLVGDMVRNAGCLVEVIVVLKDGKRGVAIIEVIA